MTLTDVAKDIGGMKSLAINAMILIWENGFERVLE